MESFLKNRIVDKINSEGTNKQTQEEEEEKKGPRRTEGEKRRETEGAGETRSPRRR